MSDRGGGCDEESARQASRTESAAEARASNSPVCFEGEANEAEAAEAADLAGATQEAAGVELSTIVAEAQWCSAQASTGVRFLAIGGFAVAWLLARGSLSGLRAPILLLAIALFIAVMAVDLAHYSTAAKLWSDFLQEQAEAGRGPGDKVVLPRAVYAATSRRYALKLWLLLGAYCALAIAFLRSIFA